MNFLARYFRFLASLSLSSLSLLAFAHSFANSVAHPSTNLNTNLTTTAERSAFLRTGRYAEVQQLCAQYGKRFPRQVKCHEFGRTPEGRPMLALAISNSGALTAQQARAKELPVVLVQAGIHAGEIDGKDAGFLLLRQMLVEGKHAELLNNLVWLFVPVFNVDGHERFGAWNRPNQRGPEQMGWRTTAQNFNLNRDYVKLDTPEMQAMMGLVQQWDVLAAVDMHVTDGAKFEHDVSIQVEPVNSGDIALRSAGRAWLNGVMAQLTAQGSLPLPFYYSFAEEDNPASGFIDSVASPRYSHTYFQLRNRFGMLVEAHSWKDYPTRIKINRNTILAVLQQISEHGKAWRTAAHQADQRASQLAGTQLALSYKTGPNQRMIAFRGYEYTRTPSEISGAIMVRYDESKPQIWQVPLRDEIFPDLEVRVPQAGYLVPPAHAKWLANKLNLHGISYTILPPQVAPRQPLPVSAWRATQATFGKKSIESRQTLKVQGDWHSEQRVLEAGSLFVPIKQAKSRLVMAMLEPKAPDSFLGWGFFNIAFEQKEYMEDYVAEDVARQQMAADPHLKAEFERKLANEPEFAKDSEKRLEFFARRHSSWDDRYMLYPIFRLDQVPK